jgi:hypothetical protein
LFFTYIHGMKRVLFAAILGSLLLGACGNGNEEKQRKQKAYRDSVRAADSVAWMRSQADILKKAGEDSILAEKEYQEQLAHYDSLRAADSLRVKYKHHPPVKPAPRRQLDGKSPVK